MPELFQQINCGPNVQHLIESDDCKIMRLNDCSGGRHDDFVSCLSWGIPHV